MNYKSNETTFFFIFTLIAWFPFLFFFFKFILLVLKTQFMLDTIKMYKRFRYDVFHLCSLNLLFDIEIEY